MKIKIKQKLVYNLETVNSTEKYCKRTICEWKKDTLRRLVLSVIKGGKKIYRNPVKEIRISGIKIF